MLALQCLRDCTDCSIDEQKQANGVILNLGTKAAVMYPDQPISKKMANPHDIETLAQHIQSVLLLKMNQE